MIFQLQKLVTILGAGKEAYCTKTGAGKETYFTKTGAGKEAYCTKTGDKVLELKNHLNPFSGQIN